MQLDIETILILGAVTLANIGLAWVSSSYAKIAGDAARRVIDAEAAQEPPKAPKAISGVVHHKQD